MNQHENAIIESLIANSSLEFMELLREVNNKTKISKTTLKKYLTQFETQGLVKHQKKKYFLKTTKGIKKQYKDISKELFKLEKNIDELSRSSDIFRDCFNLLTKMFRGVYTPMLFDLYCNGKNLNSYQKYAIKKNIKRCEEMFKKVEDILEDENYTIAQDVLGVIKLGYL